MNPLTGAPDSSDRLRAMHYWLLGSPPAVLPIVEGEVALQQAKSNQARQQRLTAIVDATYPPNPGFAQPDPQIDAVRVRGQLFAGPTIRMRGGDTLAHVRVVLSITNSPLALSFLVDPAISEDAFRTLVQAQYAVIAAAAP